MAFVKKYLFHPGRSPENRVEEKYCFFNDTIVIDKYFWRRSPSKREKNCNPLRTDWGTWTRITAAYPMLCENLSELPPNCDDDEFLVITKMIIDKKLSYSVTTHVLGTILKQIKTEMATRWKNFEPIADDPKKVNKMTENELYAKDLAGFLRFTSAVDELYLITHPKMFYIDRLQCLHENERTTVTKNFLLRLSQLIYENLPNGHSANVYQFYRTGLRAITQGQINSIIPSSNSSTCNICLAKAIECVCVDLIRLFNRTNRQLNTMDVVDWLAKDAVINIITNKIESIVKKLDTNLQACQLLYLENWLNITVHYWMKITFEPMPYNTTGSQFSAVMRKLSVHLYKTYCRLRLTQLYDIAAEYPESRQTVDDLAIAYKYAKLSDPDLQLIFMGIENSKSYNNMREMRGNLVLSMYTTTKHILKTVDPSGYIFEEFSKILQ